jgi:hypothetical protein
LKPRDAEAFTALLRETVDRLQAAQDALVEDITQLALVGPWAKWSDAQAVGTVMTFERDALRNTGDARITALCDAADALHLTLESLLHYRA